MEETVGFVSLWLAKINNENSLNNFLNITYMEDGSYQNSVFGEHFKTGYYSESFKESEFLDDYSNNLVDLLEGFSYDEIIAPRFMELIPELEDNFNTVIMLYNYIYQDQIHEYTSKDIFCEFLGCVSYS